MIKDRLFSVLWFCMALAIVTLDPRPATASIRGDPRWVDIVLDSDAIVLARATAPSEVLGSPFAIELQFSVPVRGLRTLAGTSDVPTSVVSYAPVKRGQPLVLFRRTGEPWSVTTNLLASQNSWPVASVPTPAIERTVADIRAFRTVADSDAKAAVVERMLRAEQVQVRAAGLDLISHDPSIRGLPRLFTGIAARVRCSDPLALRAMGLLRAYQPPQAYPLLLAMLGCKDDRLASFAQRELNGSCTIALERARSPATRREELAAFNGCWKPKWAKAEEDFRRQHGGKGPMD